jgi:hypothetical protein
MASRLVIWKTSRKSKKASSRGQQMVQGLARLASL